MSWPYAVNGYSTEGLFSTLKENFLVHSTLQTNYPLKIVGISICVCAAVFLNTDAILIRDLPDDAEITVS